MPAALFQPLAAQGARIYSAALLTLFEETVRQRQPLSRDLAVTVIMEILADPEAMRDTSDIEQGAIGDESDDCRARAGAILRYLSRSGWLREENGADFSRTYIMPDYAFRLLRALAEIATSEAPPLQGLILSIHDLLHAALRDGNAHFRIPEAYRQTMHLVNHLQELQHNIGAHIERILLQVTTSGILDHIFSTYHEEILRRAYHLLRTTEHLGRFHPDIIHALVELERAGIAAASEQALPNPQGRATDAAITPDILDMLHAIREQFDSLDGLLQSIDRRHAQFIDAAVRAVDRYMAASASTSGQLHALLERLLVDESDPEGTLPPMVETLFSLHRLELLDVASLSLPSRGAAAFSPDPAPLSAPTREEIAQAQARTLAHLRRAASRARIGRLAEELLGGRAEVWASELPLGSAEDLPLLIYLRQYGDGLLGYRVIEPPERLWLERHGFGFHDFMIRATPAAHPPMHRTAVASGAGDRA